MDACHLLLGRPWQYDRNVGHDGKRNTYNFMFNNTKIVLLPNKKFTLPQDLGNYLLGKKQFIDVVAEIKRVYILLGKESNGDSKIPDLFLFWRNFKICSSMSYHRAYYLFGLYNTKLIWYQVLHYQIDLIIL